jgi:hypothetical protein
LKVLQGLRVDGEGFAHKLGDGFSGEVVIRRTKASCGQNQVRALGCLLKGLHQHTYVIFGLGYSLQLDSQRWQLGCKVRSVGIH